MIKVCHLSSAHHRFDTRIFYKQCQSLASDNRLVSLVIADGLGNENRDNISIFDVGKQKNRFRYARCIVAKKNLKKNNYISKDCLAIKRPNIETLDSIEPIEINKIIGRKIRKDILYDTPLKKSDLK